MKKDKANRQQKLSTSNFFAEDVLTGITRPHPLCHYHPNSNISTRMALKLAPSETKWVRWLVTPFSPLGWVSLFDFATFWTSAQIEFAQMCHPRHRTVGPLWRNFWTNLIETVSTKTNEPLFLKVSIHLFFGSKTNTVCEENNFAISAKNDHARNR